MRLYIANMLYVTCISLACWIFWLFLFQWIKCSRMTGFGNFSVHYFQGTENAPHCKCATPRVVNVWSLFGIEHLEVTCVRVWRCSNFIACSEIRSNMLYPMSCFVDFKNPVKSVGRESLTSSFQGYRKLCLRFLRWEFLKTTLIK